MPRGWGLSSACCARLALVGFTLVFARAQTTNDTPPAAGADNHRPPPSPDGAQRSDEPFGLRGSEDGPRFTVRLSTDYRHASHGDVYALRAGATASLGNGFRLVASVRAARGNNDHVRQLDGTFAVLRKSVISGSAGVGYDLGDDGDIRAEALYSPAGFGGALSGNAHSDIAKVGFYSAWRAPYLFNTEEIADHGSRDIARIFGTTRLTPVLWARAEGRYERFGVRGDSNVATTAGFTAGLRYMPDWFGFPFGIGYDADADYVLTAHHYTGVPPTPFVPMNIHTREVHAVSGIARVPLPFEHTTLDLYGGYAADRYGPNGGFGGGDIAIVPSEGWKLLIGGYYTQVPNRQSGGAPVIAATVRLTYDLSHTAPDPFSPGFLPDEI